MDLAALVTSLARTLFVSRVGLQVAMPRRPARPFIARLDEDLESVAAVLVLAVQELLTVAQLHHDDEAWSAIAEACAAVLVRELAAYEGEHGMVGF